MQTILSELNRLYEELPGVPCKACGACCVSPTCTFPEFLALMRYLLETHSREKISRLLLTPPEFHPDYEGNLRCMFQDRADGRCQVHPARTLACRLFGLPAISELAIHNLENCRKMDAAQMPKVEQAQLTGWLDWLTRLNGETAPFYREPYWVSGLNVECWLAIYFDPYLDSDIFLDYKKVLHDAIDLNFLAETYRDRTDLKGKTDRIALLYGIVQTGDRETSLSLIQDIRTNYPYTGTYYLEELDKIEKMVSN